MRPWLPPEPELKLLLVRLLTVVVLPNILLHTYVCRTLLSCTGLCVSCAVAHFGIVS